MQSNVILPPLPPQSRLDLVCGNPRGPGGGEVSRSWYAANIVRIPAPWPMTMGTIRIREITVHRRFRVRLELMFSDIRQLALSVSVTDDAVQGILDNWGMSDYGGGFNYRKKRSGSTLSTHAYGIAWDFDADRNGFRDATPRFAEFPQLVAIFRKYGVWGGDWKTNTDGMHIQFARVG